MRLSHNTPELIEQELLDPNTLYLIAKSHHLSAEDLATVQLTQEPGIPGLMFYRLGERAEAWIVLKAELGNYVSAREDGHTRAFLLAALTNRVAPSVISDPDLRALLLQRPLLPPSLLKKTESGTRTNKAGEVESISTTTTVENGKTVTHETTHIPKTNEVCRWVSYVLVDGEIAWQYRVQFKADGTTDYVYEEKRDAKECDPKYQKLVAEAETEARAEMKRRGIPEEQLGAVHTFWRLKKEKLKARGIDWRSPAELNRNASYD